MNTEQLIKRYSRKLGVTEEVGTNHLKTLISVVEEALLEEDSVSLRGIGRIIPKELAGRRGVTPTGKDYRHPKRLTLRIVPSGIFKKKLNSSRRQD